MTDISESARTYELGFNLVPTIPEQEVAAQVEALKVLIEKAGGTVGAIGNPEFIDLAYQMEKNVGSKRSRYNQTYFGWIKFEMTPESMEVLKKSLDSVNELIRYILLKANVENTIVFKKPKVEPKRDAASDNLEEVAEEAEVLEDVQEVHETLPDVAADIAEEPTVTE
jgi:ribosomal protein S6